MNNLKMRKKKMEQDFEIEREYFREEIDSLQRQIEIQNAGSNNNDKANFISDPGVADRTCTSSIATDKESGVTSPNQWRAFQHV